MPNALTVIKKPRRVLPGILCPHCCEYRACRWGKLKDGSQRFRCQGCHKTFNEYTGTPIARTRKKGSWPQFAHTMKLGMSSGVAGPVCGVSPKTIPKWRHKVLGHLDALTNLVSSKATLCTDGGAAFPKATKKLNIRHVALNTHKGVRKRGVYHTNTVNAAHSQLKQFMSVFRGVSSKHLARYMEWYRSRESIGASLPILSPVCPTCGK